MTFDTTIEVLKKEIQQNEIRLNDWMDVKREKDYKSNGQVEAMIELYEHQIKEYEQAIEILK